VLQQTLTIEGHRVRVGNVLASGGFGFGAAVLATALRTRSARGS
jgi:hypothetical protein